MNRSDLNEYFQSVSPTEEQKNRMLTEILCKKKGNFIMKNTRRFTLAMAVASILVLTSAVTFAAVKLNWDDKLVEFLKPTSEQIENMDGAVQVPKAEAEVEGMNIAVKQTLGDENGIYIVYEVTGPEDLEFKDDYLFENSNVTLSGKSMGYAWSEQVIEATENSRTYISYLNCTEDLTGKEIQLSFENFGYRIAGEPDTEWEFKNIIEGKWDISWKIENSAETKTYYVDKKVGEGTVKEIEVTPFCVKMIMKCSQAQEISQLTLKQKDGTDVVADGQLYTEWTDNGEQTIIASFGSVMNMEDVTGITLNGVKVL